jgi:probable HAF family extracellular repeat protein
MKSRTLTCITAMTLLAAFAISVPLAAQDQENKKEHRRYSVIDIGTLLGDTVLRAFLWQNGVITNLGVFPGDVHSLALGINDKGQIVGDSCDASFSCRAIVWQNGTIADLNGLVHDTNAPYLENANSINSRGQIAGKTTVQGTPIADAFLAIPCDEEHADNEGCEGEGEGTTAAIQNSPAPVDQTSTNVTQGRLTPGDVGCTTRPMGSSVSHFRPWRAEVLVPARDGHGGKNISGVLFRPPDSIITSWAQRK